MGSFGDKLRREREMRGVTLDEIAESTKIRRSHLEALEKEDFRNLPGGVFNKGFVRSYARFIGIDEDQAVADYAAISNEIAPPEDQFPLEVHEKPDRKLNPRSSQLPLIASVVALVILVAGYVVYRAKHHQPESVAAAVSADSTSNSQPVEEHESTATETKAVPVKETLPAHQPESHTASAEPVKRMSTPDKALSPEHSFFIIIKAKEDAWVSVVADGRRVSHGILKADKQRFIRAARQIVVKTGNAGGIDVSFNGRPLGAIGNESEARTLMFTPTGAAQQ
ncbi:MAG TPA: RodZ domain-containing protein [Verrucomicrobiae bacterium]|nr:RodZ domain-containing protein [Verrucomicrobiae bacterium]